MVDDRDKVINCCQHNLCAPAKRCKRYAQTGEYKTKLMGFGHLSEELWENIRGGHSDYDSYQARDHCALNIQYLIK